MSPHPTTTPTGLQHGHTYLALKVVRLAHVHLAVVQQHPIDVVSNVVAPILGAGDARHADPEGEEMNGEEERGGD